MYKLFNLLFGYDYIAWKNSADYGIARVHKSPNGEVWYWRYKITNVVDIVEKASDVIWLTCHSSKYFK